MPKEGTQETYMQEPYLPKPTTAVFRAFPADVTPYMSDPAVIPDDFMQGRTAWNALFNKMFFDGIPENTEFHFREGIDHLTAYHHILSLMGSFQQKHQVKDTSVAYLLSLWCTKVVREKVTYA